MRRKVLFTILSLVLILTFMPLFSFAADASDSDEKGAKFAAFMLRSPKQSENSILLEWEAQTDAVRYVIYGNMCNTNGEIRKAVKLVTTTSSTYNVRRLDDGERLKPNTYHKFYIKAYDKNGNSTGTSAMIHVTTKGGKNKNFSKVTVSKSKVSLKKGTTYKIKAKAAGKNVDDHTGLRYETSSRKIASVSESGKIKGKKKGTAVVYVYSQNGKYKTIKVKVH